MALESCHKGSKAPSARGLVVDEEMSARPLHGWLGDRKDDRPAKKHTPLFSRGSLLDSMEEDRRKKWLNWHHQEKRPLNGSNSNQRLKMFYQT